MARNVCVLVDVGANGREILAVFPNGEIREYQTRKQAERLISQWFHLNGIRVGIIEWRKQQ